MPVSWQNISPFRFSLDFMQVSSYGNATSSSGIVRIKKDLDDSMEGKEVIIVEDIIDSGRTLHYLIPVLKQRESGEHSALRASQ